MRYHGDVNRCCLLLACVVAHVVALAGLESPLTRTALEEAVSIGQTRSDAVLARFNTAYQVPVNRPPVDYLEVVTPFRRVVLAAETRASHGERMFGQADALAVLGSTPDRVDLIVELTFHPLNTYIGVPLYSVSLAPGRRPADPEAVRSEPIDPLELARIPRSGPRVRGAPLPYPYVTGPQPLTGSEPVVGGAVIATFDGRRLAVDGVYDAVIAEGMKEVARAPIAFGRLR